MADEAFALSPINARAAMPSDADYDAIREAFMETSRGRWFLSEYAKRNRNADTRMVLDAVARIEQNLAAQKQANGSSGLNGSLVAIHAIVGEARAEVARSIAGLGNAAVLTAARDGARIIREVSWTLRDCGADVRICNLLDNQVTAIEAGQRLVDEIDNDAVLAAFDALLDRVHDLAGEQRPHRTQPSRASNEPASPTAVGDLPETAIHVAEAAAAAEPPVPGAAMAADPPTAPASAPDPALTIITGAATDELEFVEAVEPMAATDGVVASEEMPGGESPEASIIVIEDVDSVLDLVALEMSAPQPEEPSELEAAIEAARIELEQAEAAERAEAAYAAAASEIAQSDIAQLIAEVATPHEPAIESSNDGTEPSAETAFNEAPSMEAVAEDMQNFEIGERGESLYVPQTVPEPVMAASLVLSQPAMDAHRAPPASASLGAALLASGVVGQPGQSRSDALAPLRRMSQPEKIAFFS
ncbi:hypothetical protein D4Q52_05310 [Rhodopseudomonas palustris]|uniref:Uncharacterized protein n=2 Tax=Rhodopseudomonas palustris TaxID=1076 RepID=A0A418VKN6_RHOPL|nr:hypothetical protein D4Q52_05310 [Rhodopseudomonas palustris]